MKPVSLIATASHFPEQVVPNDFFGGERGVPRGGMFRGARSRHHMNPEESAVELIARATRKLQTRVGGRMDAGVDILLTNVSMPDLPFTGCGAAVAKELGIQPRSVYDLHSHGCVSFIAMMEVARALIATTDAKTALICNVQTAAGRIFSHPRVRDMAQSAVPGDGCGVGLLVEGDERPVEQITVRCHSEYASDMQIASDDGRAWWEPGEDPFHIDFSRSKVAAVVRRANRIVPEIVQEACRDAGISASDIGTFITNQPNQIFLRNWREAMQVPESRHIDTFEEHGNLFGAAMPVCLERAEQDGKIEKDSLVVLGGFSHAGDYAAAAVVRWGAVA